MGRTEGSRDRGVPDSFRCSSSPAARGRLEGGGHLGATGRARVGEAARPWFNPPFARRARPQTRPLTRDRGAAPTRSTTRKPIPRVFDSLAQRFSRLFQGLARGGRLTESNVADGVREVRTALLEADVSLEV